MINDIFLARGVGRREVAMTCERVRRASERGE